MLNKKLKQLLMVLAFTLASNNVVFAQPAASNVNNYSSKVQGLEQNIENLDNQIEAVMGKISDNKKQMIETQSDIKSSEVELKNAENDIKNEKDLFNQRMRALYINGTGSYLDVLLNANGLEDFLSRVDTIKKIIGFDNTIISNYEAKQNSVAQKVDNLKAENNKLVALNVDNEKKLTQLSNDKNSEEKLIVQDKAQQRLYAVAEQAQISNAVREVSTIRQYAPKLTLSRGGSPISSNNIIAYASNYLGTPYVWGGTSPNGFDCSGFVQYVYSHFGVSLGRTTYDQINDGVGVSRDQLQPGDLVFFGSSGNPTHVGMYVGNGAYINAPHTGDVVKISPLDRSDYITARRVR
jgi:cell wall-associated NlpC family hydrolase